jgi:hypothetical protein
MTNEDERIARPIKMGPMIYRNLQNRQLTNAESRALILDQRSWLIGAPTLLEIKHPNPSSRPQTFTGSILSLTLFFSTPVRRLLAHYLRTGMIL